MFRTGLVGGVGEQMQHKPCVFMYDLRHTHGFNGVIIPNRRRRLPASDVRFRFF